MGDAIPSKLCGRPFDGADLERIRREIVAANPPLRSKIARQVCRVLKWTNARGELELISARVGLLRHIPHYFAFSKLPCSEQAHFRERDLRRFPNQGPTGFSVYACPAHLFAGHKAPRQDQHSIRVGG